MTIPRISNKHSMPYMFSVGFLMGGVKKGTKLPSKAIIVYANSIEKLLCEKFGLERLKDLENAVVNYNTLSMYKSRLYPDLMVIRLAIGAPLTAMISEDIIRLGVKEILIIGEAGGIRQDLSPGRIVLCTKALRDTGTSEHYIKGGMYVDADRSLTKHIGTLMEKAGVDHVAGPTWSIDAPYTETRGEVERYSKMGVVTVEMEAAALFAVTVKRKARACAVFIVSDVLRLDSGWTGFDSGKEYSKGFKKLAEIAKLFATS
ncbi:MAG: nucleoside phosphorylase [Candidatus Micrarchaeota archaeon]|nr:nucleoside phosphorylase [Candidatus Micrarchaeota archaeon]MDE1834961.1 nucleoside phosphorylase [Candidatus Micrarchaeota archaeon]MDE1859267.1 nucleoside phosphorylase [Candidatus Micrarchaeota archaeon]